MPFQPGQSGRPGYNGKPVFDAIVREVKQNPAKLKAAIAAQLDKAAEGNLDSLDWITTRLEGKARQAVEIDHTHRTIKEYTLNELKSLIANEIIDITPETGGGEVAVGAIAAGVGTAGVGSGNAALQISNVDSLLPISNTDSSLPISSLESTLLISPAGSDD